MADPRTVTIAVGLELHRRTGRHTVLASFVKGGSEVGVSTRLNGTPLDNFTVVVDGGALHGTIPMPVCVDHEQTSSDHRPAQGVTAADR